MDNLKNALYAYVKFTAREIENISKRFEKITIAKNTVILSENEVCNTLWYINSGCLALTYKHNSQERIVQMFAANSFAIDLCSYLQQKPENMRIESLMTSELMTLSKENFDELYAGMQNWRTFIHRYTEEAFLFFATEVLQIKSHSNEERYFRLQNEQPELFKQMPLYVIAKYLGMTPVGLSKMRGRTHRFTKNVKRLRK